MLYDIDNLMFGKYQSKFDKIPPFLFRCFAFVINARNELTLDGVEITKFLAQVKPSDTSHAH